MAAVEMFPQPADGVSVTREGEDDEIKVTTFASGHVVREVDRPPPPPAPWTTALRIMQRTIGTGEWAAFRSAALEGVAPLAMSPAQAQTVRDAWDLFAKYGPNDIIHSDDPLTVALFDALVAVGILANADRVAAIFAP